ncbi:MAG: 30S ribosomal protein S14 [Candidatus Shikimatogenerans sp. AspAUS03]|uniref:Small ribosomal subunit protein uS14 n=1 Tax=Candidatus Shikimatogenerans sp. AspAUS03 TaxID=3158563 RepID=A0AAU7QUQ6_9FLAO
MSRKSLLFKQIKIQKLVFKFKNKRNILIKNKQWLELQTIPKNASKVRLKNFCSITGRSRGYLRLFGISRIMFKKLVSLGYLPGVKKYSW